MDLEQLKAREKQKIEEKRQGDLIIFLLLIVICIGWLVLTFLIPHRDKLTWPGSLPTLLLSLIIVMAGSVVLKLYIPNPEYRNFRNLFRRILLVLQNIQGPFYRGILTVAILLAYVSLLKYLPYLLPPTYSYIISTVLFIAGLILTFRAASVWVTALVTVIATIGLYLAFGMFYHVPLP
jgi:hypothetical protein